METLLSLEESLSGMHATLSLGDLEGAAVEMCTLAAEEL